MKEKLWANKLSYRRHRMTLQYAFVTFFIQYSLFSLYLLNRPTKPVPFIR